MGEIITPSVDSLKWIIESRNQIKKCKKRKKCKKIVFTNSTSNIVKIVKDYDQKKYD